MAGCHAMSKAADVSRDSPATPRLLFDSLLSIWFHKAKIVASLILRMLEPLMKPRWALLHHPSGFR